VTPVLIVADVRSAVAWYTEVFGFVEHVRIGEGIARDSACLMAAGRARNRLGSAGRRTPERERSHQMMLKVADVAKAVAATEARGAQLVDEIQDWDYGERPGRDR
jgi:PhnB protein